MFRDRRTALTLMIRVCLPLALFCSAAERLTAAGAAYSKDSRWLFHLTREEPGVVVRLDCSVKPSEREKSARKTVFPEELADIARLPSGELAVASDKTLWRWTPDKGAEGIKPWLKAPDGAEIRWLAAGTAEGTPLLVGGMPAGKNANPQWPLWRAQPGSGELVEVNCRRVPRIESLVFTDRERFVFSSAGDLWYGIIEEDEDEGKPRPGLIARRWFPCAESETYPGTPSGSGAYAVAASGGRIFFEHSRMGGSGWGRVLSIPAPAPPKGDGEFDHLLPLEERLAEYTRLTAGLEEIATTGGVGVQFVTPADGSRTDYRPNEAELFLPCEKSAPAEKSAEAPR